LFKAALLDQVKERGEEREEKGGVGGEKESDVEEDPTGMEDGEGCALLPGVEGGEETEEEADWKDEDSERNRLVSPINDEEREGEEEAEEGLGLVSVDWQAMVGSAEHLGERDKVEEDSCDGGGDGYVTPAGPVVEGGGQDRERGYAVEEDRDSEPEERHNELSQALNSRIFSISGMER
jgi:hypothetical protein